MAIAMLATGCAELGISLQPPAAPVRLIDVAPTPIERAALSEDGRWVALEFTGGPEFDPDDPCSVEYEASVDIVHGELQIGLFALAHPRPVPDGWGCEAMGHARRMVVELAAPYEGDELRDLSGGTVTLRRK
jgi:hypothetical protein